MRHPSGTVDDARARGEELAPCSCAMEARTIAPPSESALTPPRCARPGRGPQRSGYRNPRTRIPLSPIPILGGRDELRRRISWRSCGARGSRSGRESFRRCPRCFRGRSSPSPGPWCRFRAVTGRVFARRRARALSLHRSPGSSFTQSRRATSRRRTPSTARRGGTNHASLVPSITARPRTPEGCGGCFLGLPRGASPLLSMRASSRCSASCPWACRCASRDFSLMSYPRMPFPNAEARSTPTPATSATPSCGGDRARGGRTRGATRRRPSYPRVGGGRGGDDDGAATTTRRPRAGRRDGVRDGGRREGEHIRPRFSDASGTSRPFSVDRRLRLF